MKIILILLLASSYTLAAVQSSTPSTTSSITSGTEVIKIVKKKSDLNFSILNQFEFQNYFTDNTRYKPQTIYTLTPELGYRVPETQLNLGLAVPLVSKLNNLNNEGRKMDVGEVTFKAFYPVWKNNNGTSVSTFAMLNGYAFSTLAGQWEKFENRIYANVSLSQDIGYANVAVYPHLAYYINPNYQRGNIDFRAGVDWRANYKIVPSFSVFHKQKYRKYYRAVSQYEFLAEYGMKYIYRDWSFETYVSRYSRNLEKLWSIREQKDVWVNLNIGLKL